MTLWSMGTNGVGGKYSSGGAAVALIVAVRRGMDVPASVFLGCAPFEPYEASAVPPIGMGRYNGMHLRQDPQPRASRSSKLRSAEAPNPTGLWRAPRFTMFGGPYIVSSDSAVRTLAAGRARRAARGARRNENRAANAQTQSERWTPRALLPGPHSLAACSVLLPAACPLCLRCLLRPMSFSMDPTLRCFVCVSPRARRVSKAWEATSWSWRKRRTATRRWSMRLCFRCFRCATRFCCAFPRYSRVLTTTRECFRSRRQTDSRSSKPCRSHLCAVRLGTLLVPATLACVALSIRSSQLVDYSHALLSPIVTVT